LRLRLCRLRQRTRQDAVRECRLRLVLVHGRWERDGAGKGAVADLTAVEVLALGLVVVLLLALDGENAVVDGDVDVLCLHTRQARLHDDLVVGLREIDRRREVESSDVTGAHAPAVRAENATQAADRCARIAANYGPHLP